MSSVSPSRLLRHALLADAAASAATGLLLAFGATPLAPLLGLPEQLMQGAGLALVPLAGAIAVLATRPSALAALYWAMIVLNMLWVADSVVLLFSGAVSPTGLGTAFVLAQALAVAAVTQAEIIGLRRSRAMALSLRPSA
jgi:hypothetical protein